MALIGKIRNNSWLLIVLIGLGLGGFIVMDMTSGQQSVFGGGQTTVGEIEGEKIDWNQFNRTENILYGNTSGDVYSRRQMLWNFFVENSIVLQEAEKLGIGVSRDELLDLQFGPNPSPVIRQRFQDPNTFQLNRQRLNEFKAAIENNTLDPSIRSFWAHQEREIIKERLQSKINFMVTKAMFTPTWMAEMGYVDQNQEIDFTFVKVPFDEIDNAEVELTEADFENYLEENEARYRQEEQTRRIDYVVFDVMPTAADSAMWKERIAELIPEFEETEEDSLFVERNYGSIDAAYFKSDQLSATIADVVFELPVGSVYGPYIDGGNYRAVKVLDRMVVPDSVRARHILIQAGNPTQLFQAQQTVDSLKNLIIDGVHTFDSLATAFGSDVTANSGGDLGWSAPGQMVKPFNDLIFYEAEIGELNTVVTQFGAHLVEVTDRKYLDDEEGVKLAYLTQSIVPSEETQNNIYDEVLQFVADNRNLDQLAASAASDPRLSLETSPPLRKNDFTVGSLGSGQTSRDIVKWAFSVDKGEVSPEIYIYQDEVDFYNDKYVVVGLNTVIEAGLPDVDEIRPDIEQLVINQKKADMIASRIAGMGMSTIADEYDVPVDSVSGAKFSDRFVSPLGNEPKVLGTAFSLEEEAVSGPIKGNSGVFVVQLQRKPLMPTATNIPAIRKNMSSTAKAEVNTRLIQAMKKEAEVEDYRSRFY